MSIDMKPIKWDRPVHKNGTVTIPKQILDALGNPEFVRFEVVDGRVFLRKVDKQEVKNNDTVQKEA